MFHPIPIQGSCFIQFSMVVGFNARFSSNKGFQWKFGKIVPKSPKGSQGRRSRGSWCRNMSPMSLWAGYWLGGFASYICSIYVNWFCSPEYIFFEECLSAVYVDFCWTPSYPTRKLYMVMGNIFHIGALPCTTMGPLITILHSGIWLSVPWMNPISMNYLYHGIVSPHSRGNSWLMMPLTGNAVFIALTRGIRFILELAKLGFLEESCYFKNWFHNPTWIWG